jgi:hypothetical protein
MFMGAAIALSGDVTSAFRAMTIKAKVRSRGQGGPQNILKSYMLRGVFPPSQKLKDIPTKCTFLVNFVGKTLR